eukprot:CCRYP_008118-RD/>CCRYP_008118-RD protein AED:0.48 eAED:1.00 QI:0/0/0/1/0/0/2/0/84
MLSVETFSLTCELWNRDPIELFFKASSSTVYCPSSPPPFSNERNAKETRFLIALAGNTLNGVVPEYPYLRRMAKEKACIVPLHN